MNKIISSDQLVFNTCTTRFFNSVFEWQELVRERRYFQLKFLRFALLEYFSHKIRTLTKIIPPRNMISSETTPKFSLV